MVSEPDAHTHIQVAPLKMTFYCSPNRTLFYLFSYITSASRAPGPPGTMARQQTGSKITNRRAQSRRMDDDLHIMGERTRRRRRSLCTLL